MKSTLSQRGSPQRVWLSNDDYRTSRDQPQTLYRLRGIIDTLYSAVNSVYGGTYVYSVYGGTYVYSVYGGTYIVSMVVYSVYGVCLWWYIVSMVVYGVYGGI